MTRVQTLSRPRAARAGGGRCTWGALVIQDVPLTNELADAELRVLSHGFQARRNVAKVKPLPGGNGFYGVKYKKEIGLGEKLPRKAIPAARRKALVAVDIRDPGALLPEIEAVLEEFHAEDAQRTGFARDAWSKPANGPSDDRG